MAGTGSRLELYRAVLISSLVSLAVAIGLIAAENVAIRTYFPHLARFATDFSPAYLRRELEFIAAGRPQTIFIGDSVLWGYGLQADQTAVALMTLRGCACRNLSFKSGNPPNYYFLTRLLLELGVRPRAVILEVNQKVLNESDAEYQTLHPGLAALARPLITARDRSELMLLPQPAAMQQRLDAALSSTSDLYAMRSDIRETFFAREPAAAVPKLTPAVFEGTYDLIPLDEKNIGVQFLEQTVDLWHRNGIPVVAFMTPTNHGLLHRYIDNSNYRANVAFLERHLARRGALVLNFDAALPASDFVDNAHLTFAGQQRLASLISKALGSYIN